MCSFAKPAAISQLPVFARIAELLKPARFGAHEPLQQRARGVAKARGCDSAADDPRIGPGIETAIRRSGSLGQSHDFQTHNL